MVESAHSEYSEVVVRSVRLAISTELLAAMVAVAQTLPRDFLLPTPLYASSSAWNQSAASARVLPESEQQILTLYRVLLGDNSTLHPRGTVLSDRYPFPFVNYETYSVSVSRLGRETQAVQLRDYQGNASANSAKLPPDPQGNVTVPAPAGTVRPAGPESRDADGHLVLFDPATFTEYDYWQATTARDATGASLGGGQLGQRVLAAGAVDFFDSRGTGANAATVSSARAAGTPLLAGLILPEDIERGAISHALSLAIPGPRNTNLADPSEPLPGDYYYPASSTEADFFNSSPFALASGQRQRLKASLVNSSGSPLDESQLAPVTRIFLRALRQYGAYLVDNAGGFVFYAEDIHTARLNLPDSEVIRLAGRPPGTPLPAERTRWHFLLEVLNEELAGIPLAYGPPADDPRTAMISASNFEVIEPATLPYAGPPAINPGGVVNGASFAGRVAPGSLVSVFGVNLASQTAVAASLPLPLTLGASPASSFRIAGVPAPLFFVSSQQANLQAPWEVAGSAAVTAAVGSAESSPQNVSILPFAPGIFTTAQSGQGQGVVQIANSTVLAAPENSIPGAQTRPARRGEFLTIYCTGLGDVSNRPATGAAASVNVLSPTRTMPAVTIGGMTTRVSFAGLTPGFVGLYQVNVEVPPGAPSGAAVAVALTVGGISSNTATVAIQ